MLARYLKAADSCGRFCCGRISFDMAFRREDGQVFPGKSLEKLPPEHPLYNATTRSARWTTRRGCGRTTVPFTSPELEAISVTAAWR